MEEQRKNERSATSGEAFEEFLARSGLSAGDALALMEAAMQRREAVMALARQVLDGIEAIGDDRFTVEALRSHPEALRAIEEGAPVGEVYRRYFLTPMWTPPQETEANLGLGGLSGETLTPEEIERISEYVSRAGRYEF